MEYRKTDKSLAVTVSGRGSRGDVVALGDEGGGGSGGGGWDGGTGGKWGGEGVV